MPFSHIEGSKVMYTCDACGQPFQQGQGRYEGTHLHELNITVCRGCGPDDMSVRSRNEALARLAHL